MLKWKHEIYLHFLSFLNTEMAQVGETDNTKAADNLAIQGAGASAAMLLVLPEYSGFSTNRYKYQQNVTSIFIWH